MATIDIFPLSIGGVKLPGNILDSVLTKNDTSRLLYPLDLVNNPIYGHAIQFTIYEYSYPNLESSANKVEDSIVNFTKNSMTDGKFDVKKAINNAKSVSPENLAVLANFITPSNYVPHRDKTLANISLYLPDTLTTSFDSDYTAVSLTETFSAAGVLTSGYQAYKKHFDPLKGKNDFANMAARGAISAAADGITKGLEIGRAHV